MTEESPKLAELPAACCGRRIVRFDLPSRLQELFAKDAARHGWHRQANGEWLCDEHAAPAHLKQIIDDLRATLARVEVACQALESKGYQPAYRQAAQWVRAAVTGLAEETT